MSSKKAKLFNLKLFPMDMARLICAVLLPIYRLKRLTPEGEKYKNKVKGGAIVVANHSSFEDPFLVGVSFWYRRMFFLAADVVMKGKLRSALLYGVGAIKITREITDINAIKKSVATLQNGHLLSVFPQGGIDREKDVETIKSGAVLIALKADVPIIPMHIYPKKHWYNRRKVVIGKTLYPKEYITKKIPTTSDINNITEILMNEMQRCMNQG